MRFPRSSPSAPDTLSACSKEVEAWPLFHVKDKRLAECGKMLGLLSTVLRISVALFATTVPVDQNFLRVESYLKVVGVILWLPFDLYN